MTAPQLQNKCSQGCRPVDCKSWSSCCGPKSVAASSTRCTRHKARTDHQHPHAMPGGHQHTSLSSPIMDIFKRLYAVEALDVRFKSKTGQALTASKPRWTSPEFYVYYFAFLTIPPLMFKAVYDVSGPWHPTYKTYEHLLEPGWIPGRLVDNSDAQYRSFRDNLPYMFLLLTLHPILRRAYQSLQVRRVQSVG